MKDDIKFLSTKLKMPVPRKNFIRRDKLILKLNSILEYKVTLIKGTAASGKTTLISAFLSENKFINAEWISLDKDNNDLFSFWYYFLEAVKDYLGDENKDISDFFKTILSNNDVEKLVTMLINATNREAELIIILDDFHHITDNYLLETIEYFIKYSAPNVHMVLLSREQPLIYLGDLVMADELLEIDEEALRFSYDEGARFLKDTLKMNIDSDLIYKISNAAEGWVGGLQLIALASNNSGINDVKILNKYMIDYLSKEIVNSLDEKERKFLINTSELSYFNCDICNELLQITDAEQIINELLEKNLFIINLDEEKGLYRYHNILGEFLKLEFEKLNKNIKEEIHLKAAKIFERLRDFDESLEHLLYVKHYKEALKIIEALGENPKGWTFLIRIPDEYILENKGLMLQKLFHYFCNVEIEKCKKIIKAALIREDYKDMSSVLNFFMVIIEEQYPNKTLLTLEEIDKLKISEVSKAIMYMAVFWYLSIPDNYEQFNTLLERTIAIEKHYKNSYIRFFALNAKAQFKEEVGDLLEAEDIYKQIFRMLDKYPILGKLKANAYIGVIGIYLKSFQLNKAEEYLKKANEALYKNYLGMESGYVFNLIEYNLLIGHKQEVLQLSKRLFLFNKYREFFHSAIINFMMLSNNVNEEKLKQYVVKFEKETVHLTRDKLVYSRALIMLGKPEEAEKVINEVLEVTRKYKIKTVLIKAILIKIDILNINYAVNKREILNLLVEAVHYSSENSIIEPYIVEGKNAGKFLMLLKNERLKDLNSTEKKFINIVLGYLQVEQKEEILSDREKEVLEVLATGASNKEIGKNLCISVSTVKTHIINIYSKLGVSNRVEVVEKARELGIG